MSVDPIEVAVEDLMASQNLDSIVVICTRSDGKSQSTQSFAHWRGNSYACEASAREWVLQNDELIRRKARPASDHGGCDEGDAQL